MKLPSIVAIKERGSANQQSENSVTPASLLPRQNDETSLSFCTDINDHAHIEEAVLGSSILLLFLRALGIRQCPFKTNVIRGSGLDGSEHW